MFNLSLSPSQIEFVIRPGASLTQAYQVANNSDQAITLNTKILPFLPSNDTGSVNYQNVSPNPNIIFSLNNADLQLGQPFTLPPRSQKQLVLKINTLSTNPTDVYFTFFVYQTPSISANEGNITQTTGEIGSHLLLTLAATETPTTQGQIQKFSTSPRLKDVFFTPISFTAQIRNDTDHFFKTTGKIIISKNSKIITEINLDDNNVLANHARQITCQHQTCALSPPLWPGHYSASLELNPNLNIKPVSLSFFVFPISPLLTIAFISLIIFVFKKFKKMTKKNTGE
ncbi:MAG TPA: hypothetical protein PKZ92_03790 [Candidatus Woesebacteria bacterium]|jgi:hypothetical protein|nr:hypothetical protein [Candidatus Shapirobacteria bacterium]HOR02350.1 hypothetical protein [Candidatus Woesebacteria bacterium]